MPPIKCYVKHVAVLTFLAFILLWKHAEDVGRQQVTWELPRFATVEVDFCDVDAGKGAVKDLGGEVEGDELFVGGMKPKTRRQTLLVILISIQL